MAIREGLSIAVLTLCVILTAHVTQGSVLGRRSRRAASLDCRDGETHIFSANVTVTGSDCGAVIGQPPEFFDKAYREQCQRWMGTADVPYMVENSYISRCMENTDGTVTYQAEICCPGVLTGQSCFECTNASYHYQCNFDSGNVARCGADEICQTTYDFYVNYPRTVRRVSKSCQPRTTCNAAATDNTNTCRHWLPKPSCSYCCEGDFCNYESSEPFYWVADYPCVYNSCYNGGTCVNLNTTHYVCTCAPNYTGNRCQTGIGCHGTPCTSYGTCVADNSTTGYYCVCPPGRYGDRCEYSYCVNNGIWQLNSATGYKCLCRPRFGGINCSEAIDECPNNGTAFCQNGGTCMDYGTYGLRCICPDGYIGHYCERAVRQCFDDSSAFQYSAGFSSVYSSCSYFEGVRYNYGFYMTHLLSTCRARMAPAGGVQFVNNAHGSVTSIEKFYVETCEQGEVYGNYRYAFCCPTCYSVPCQNGGWCVQKNDGDYVCKCRYGYEGRNCENKISLCIIAGDPHYHTFDDQYIGYQGVCKHTVAASADPTLPQFTVTARNQRRGGNDKVSYPEYYEISVYDDVIRLDQNQEVYVNGVRVFPEVTYPGFRIILNGRFVRLETNFSMAVEFDGRWTAVVKVPPAYGNKTQGICGNNDGNPANDLVTKEGADVTDDPMKNSKIGNSWQVDDPEDPNCTTTDEVDLPECEEPFKSEIAGEKYCGPMVDPQGVFQACLANNAMDASDFYADCQFDVCANQGDSDAMDEARCGSTEVLALKCASLGHVIDWRLELNCSLVCPKGMYYNPAAPACPATCENPDGPERCHLPNTESCMCPGTQVLSEGRCIDAELCGCYGPNGEKFKIGQVWLSGDCLTRFSCEVCKSCTRPAGHIVETNHMCQRTESCVTSNGQAVCVGDDPCEVYPCGDGGSCTQSSSGAGYTCQCFFGYQGDRCEIEMTTTMETTTEWQTTTPTDYCAYAVCNNGGTCENGDDGFSCQCLTGYTGASCETDIDDCANRPCKNGGACRDGVNAFSCTCAAGYTGETCNTDIDDCAKSPCKNGGSCRDGVNAFSCTCAAGYTGETCNTDIDDCANSPCKNGGSCRDGVNAFSCTCAAGYTGETCNTDIDDCAKSPCKNGGSCRDGVNAFSCTCAAGYTGETCNTALLDCATCDFNNNVGYLVDPAYCGCYYRCLRTALGQYHRYPRECCAGGLIWNPAALTCDFPQNVAVSGCQTSQGNTPPPTTTTTATPQGSTCPYLADPSDVHNYQVYSAGSWITLSCAGGLAWSQVACTCILGSSGPNLVPCDQDFLLYFPFDGHFNDVGCHHAVSDIYNSPALSWDAKKTKSASFSGGDRLTVGYLSNWFSGRTVTEWTVSVWFKLSGTTQGLAGLVNNGNCNNEPSFSLYLEAGNVLKGSIDTVSGPPAVVTTTVSAYSWNHAALVYDGQQVSLYYNGALVDQTAASGAMKNSQCPMNIAHHGTSQTTGQFNGFLDEIKIIDHALTAGEVLSMYQNPWQ